MKTTCALGALFLLSSALPALAQSYPGQNVTTNGGGAGNGYVLYPGGAYGRYVPNLLQPGERPGDVIHLHMPTHHHVVVAVRRHHVPRVAAATPPAPVTEPAPSAPVAPPSAMPEDSAGRLVGDGGVAAATPPPPRKPVKVAKAPAPRRVASAAPPASPPPSAAPPNSDMGAAGVPFSFDPGSAPPPPPAPAPHPTRVARATPPPATTTPSPAAAAGFRRQTTIPFPAGDSSPAAGDVNSIHAMAASLNAALASGSARVQLEAYGGGRGDKSSDARRLSLKRALVVREILIEDGIPSEKIDVRAMGGADSGALDRVDVFVRA